MKMINIGDEFQDEGPQNLALLIQGYPLPSNVLLEQVKKHIIEVSNGISVYYY